ncbi:MAG: ATP-binding cassette domain-containing protein [Bacilli bacterium]
MLAILPIFLFVAKAIAYIILIILIAMGKAEVALLVLVIGYYERIEEENKTLFTKVSQIGARTTKVYRLHQLFNYNPGTILEYGQNPKDNILGVVDFENVNFSYEKEALIKNINLHIESNSLTAIVGKSGSGKSTLFRLLLRLYKPDSGQITIDGIDIFDFTKDIYSSNVSVATQKPFIFNMSIKENLNMVNKSYTKQIEACKRVGIHDFIMTLPKGYNTILKEDATDISGGQKQLIALARTLLSESEILLFDEITSSLDPNTAKQVVKVLRNLKKDHTVIMITHKPTLMKIADKIVVMDSGRIVGEGKHKTLLEENKYYKRLQK